MSQDRKTLIRLASSMPVGDPGRRVILSALRRTASGFDARNLTQVLRRLERDAADGRAPRGLNLWATLGQEILDWTEVNKDHPDFQDWDQVSSDLRKLDDLKLRAVKLEQAVLKKRTELAKLEEPLRGSLKEFRNMVKEIMRDMP